MSTSHTPIECTKIVKVYRFLGESPQSILTSLSPSRRRIVALNGLDLHVRDGEVFALLGPNGAGKTTLAKVLSGLSRPTSGEGFVGGISVSSHVKELSRKIGMVLGNASLYHRMTARDNLVFYARLYGIPKMQERILELARLFGIETRLDSYVETFSSGMKMRLVLARALLHDPPILLLDEPTLGLDPIVASEFRKLLRTLRKTILLMTHYMEEAEEVADRVGFLSRGRLVKVDTPSNFLQELSSTVTIAIKMRGDASRLVNSLEGLALSVSETRAGEVEATVEARGIGRLLTIAAEFDISYITRRSPTLSDAFRKWTSDAL